MKIKYQTSRFFILFILICSVLYPVISYSSGQEIKVLEIFSIIVDGKVVQVSPPPVQIKENIYIPVEFISKHFEANVSLDANSRILKITQNKNSMVLILGETKAYVNDKEVELKEAPFIYKENIYLPLKWSVLSLGGKIEEKKGVIEIILQKKSFSKTQDKKLSQKKEDKVHPKKVGWISRIWITTKNKIRFTFKDEIITNKSNKIMAPLVIFLWFFSVTVLFIKRKYKESGIYIFLLFPIFFFILLVSRSTYWAALVPVGTALVGIFSSGTLEDKIDIMSDTSPYLGLVITFLGLGEVVGPAIASHNVDMIGYGIAVKIEASICGMLIRILIRTFFLKPEQYEKS